MIRTGLMCIALATMLPGMAQAQTPGARRPASVTGRYSLDRTAGGCLLDVRQTGGRIRFQLSCDRGPPSYNMGFIEGTASIARGVAVFRYTGLGGVCELRMTFGRGRMEMVQNEQNGGCGFGHGVYADGRYRRIRLRPSFDLSQNG